ncbi:MAG: hypothetical protein M3Y86_00255 [Verrucomicrobiota bacterium]|nr:hypothetical protein [Verrucomicrobiota bacterium]
MRTNFLPLSFVLLALALASCDSSRKQITGQWRADGAAAESSWIFESNGVVTTPNGPGRYSFGDGQRLKIQTPAATFVHQFEIHGDHMTWTDPGGRKTELTRVK